MTVNQAKDDEALEPVAIPALILLLVNAEKEKGSPLTEAEVLKIRDEAVCIMSPLRMREEMARSRGYLDVDIFDPWPDWLYYKKGPDGNPDSLPPSFQGYSLGDEEA